MGIPSGCTVWMVPASAGSAASGSTFITTRPDRSRRRRPDWIAAMTCPPQESWDRFVASMRQHHGVEVGEEHKPVFLTTADPAANQDETPTFGIEIGRAHV